MSDSLKPLNHSFTLPASRSCSIALPKTFQTPSTYEFDENNLNDVNKTYCFSILKSIINNDYIVTTWNQTPSRDGKVSSISLSAPVGNVDVDLTGIPKGNIPGYATYFWFIPEHEIFATIQFDSIYNGQSNLCMYLKSFLEKFSNFVVSEDPVLDVNHIDNELKILGYAPDGNDSYESLYPFFKTSLYPKTGQIQYIKDNYSRIRKIIRKEFLDLNAEENNHLFSFIGIRKKERISAPLKIKYELSCDFSSDELEEIISNWCEHHLETWDDIGFVFEGESKTYWLSKEIPREDFSLNVERENPEIINSLSLMEEISRNRSEILSIIDLDI